MKFKRKNNETIEATWDKEKNRWEVVIKKVIIFKDGELTEEKTIYEMTNEDFIFMFEPER